MTIEAANRDGPWGETVPRIDIILIAGFPDIPVMTFVEYTPVSGLPYYLNIADTLYHDRENRVRNFYF